MGILVAISIPIFTSQLDKARIATDQANVRAAKAAAVTKVLSESIDAKPYYYDAQAGLLKDTADGVAVGYGKSTNSTAALTGATNAAIKDGIISVIITAGTATAEPTVALTWLAKG